MMRRRHIKTLGFIFTLISLILGGALAVLFAVSSKNSVVFNSIQKSVLKMDSEMTSLIDKKLNKAELEKTQTGLAIFMNDTLVYWNTNEINPKLMKRRVNLGSDTICSLLSGNYYVKSYQNGAMAYYVFKQLNTTYEIDNQYFENKSNILPTFINAAIGFQPNSGGELILNRDGKVLAYCQINSKPELKKLYYYVFLPLLLMMVIGVGLMVGRQNNGKQKGKKFKIEIGIVIILVLAVIGTYLYYQINTRKENENIKKVAASLSDKRDIRFEKSFAGFMELVKADTDFRDAVFAESNVLADVVLGYAKELLFDEVMQSYIVALTVCGPEEEITVQPEGFVANCEEFFFEKRANNKHKRVGDGLYFMDYYSLDPNYLGQIDVVSADTLQHKTLYFEFYKPIAPEGFGFPQLLREANGQKPYDYSVANYRDNILVYKYGRYVYPSFLSSLQLNESEFTFSRRFKHYMVSNEEGNVLVVSVSRKNWSEKTAPFAVFFIGLLLPYLLVCWLLSHRQPRKWKDRSFRQRLQTVVLLTLGISFLAIGPVSIIYMRSLYNQKTMDSQFETTQTLGIEMRNDLDFRTLLRTASRDSWDAILQHYATTFFTDLNLYQLNGQLLATTRPEITEMNLQAPLMNADAYQNLHRDKALYYTHEERLGTGVYQSAYIPLSDANGNVMAYLNTPYFSSTADLHNEIMNFMLTYINIILVLLGIALFFVLIVTKHLTQPLALIQNKLGDIKIDQKNEPIEWNRNDEIGALVKQYNQLIVELEKSAAELKRTTAESAWRGVARQVAHEIKNSLTPMRLSVQMLQRNIENGKATPEQTQRTANTLIEQIDALSDIASSFSRYAKLPENHPQPLDLAELVGNVVNLYDNAENITFSYHYDKAKNHTFNGDKTNLNSAVGNLVKNAVQAIGSKFDGKIEVSLQVTDKTYIISVKDNGKGIKEEDKSQIFLPNFTTKTGGSGVGLSLTYNIVQSAGGTISFESEEGKGAEFVIELPK
ncbi:MAG: HAMP domain-containing histidine kinase [Bacteroidales bacterium]|nr:HAMP domain-containing histidine kinase [Bacteroidales bacterium]MBR6931623.1 HAMP domain-containing histidine kinase [Bacteroidales bacterium]